MRLECKGCPTPCYLDADIDELIPDYCPFDADKYANWMGADTIELTPIVEKVYDAVNNPSHYCEGRKFEPADVAEDWGLDKDAYLFNVFTYIARAGRKDDILQDLEKARWYLDRRIKTLKELKE